MWIKEIRLKNYRAFGEEAVVKTYKQDAPDTKHHVLIYGENGAGKTSLYRGVRALLRSSGGDTAEAFEKNVFEEVAATEYVTFRMSNGASFRFVNNLDSEAEDYPVGNPDLISAAKIGGFLDYKRLLPIYTKRATDTARKNVFDLIIGSVIRHHIITDPRDGTDRRLYEVYAELSGVLTTKRRKSWPADEAQTHLVAFEAEVRGILERLKTRVNHYLATYFKNNLEIDYSLSTFGLSEDSGPKVMLEEMSLLPKYGTYTTPHYGDFLNEARLSALALCFFLAAIKENPLGAGNLRVLYLDDVFIGMDLSNRIPLLELLKDEFVHTDRGSSFQLFLSMYDRSWYELAKYWFDQHDISTQSVEMYSEKGANPDVPDKPVIITKDLTYYEKAKKYFAARDYPTAANLLRKESEKQIRRVLPENKRMTLDEKSGKMKQDTSLESLEKKLIRYLEKNEFDTSLLLSFSTYKKIVLNPLSHDDLRAPHYRDELISTFKIVEYLQSIIVQDVVFSKEKLVGEASLDFGYTDKNNNEVVKHQIFPREQLRSLKLPDQDARFSVCECIYEINQHRSHCENLLDAIDLLLANYNQPQEIEYEEVYKHLKVKGDQKLYEYLSLKTTSPAASEAPAPTS